VRTICTQCRRELRASHELLWSRARPRAYAETPFYEGTGASSAADGLQGRTAICELLDVTDHIRELILEHRSSADIKRPPGEGMVFLRESAVSKALAGRHAAGDQQVTS